MRFKAAVDAQTTSVIRDFHCPSRPRFLNKLPQPCLCGPVSTNTDSLPSPLSLVRLRSSSLASGSPSAAHTYRRIRGSFGVLRLLRGFASQSPTDSIPRPFSGSLSLFVDVHPSPLFYAIHRPCSLSSASLCSPLITRSIEPLSQQTGRHTDDFLLPTTPDTRAGANLIPRVRQSFIVRLPQTQTPSCFFFTTWSVGSPYTPPTSAATCTTW